MVGAGFLEYICIWFLYLCVCVCVFVHSYCYFLCPGFSAEDEWWGRGACCGADMSGIPGTTIHQPRYIRSHLFLGICQAVLCYIYLP